MRTGWLVAEAAQRLLGREASRVQLARARGDNDAPLQQPADDLLFPAVPARQDRLDERTVLELGFGVTNAAYRTTPGSGDLRRSDFDATAFEDRIVAVRPRAVNAPQ